MCQLLNLIGVCSRIVLHAMLLTMFVNTTHTRLLPTPTYLDSLLRARAVLGRVWNLCSLTACELPEVSIIGPAPVLNTTGYRALGFPAAVVVHSVLGRQAA